MDDNKNQPIRFSISRDRSLSRVENVTWPWESFVERTKQIRTDPLTHEQFKALTKDKQAVRKSAHGYFVGAQFKGSARKKMFMLERQLITLDIDQATPRILIALEQGLGELGKWEYLVYSTHSHGGGDIKLRVVIPLGKPISHDLFQAVSRIAAWNIDSRMIAVDNVSFTENQLMYWPVHCADIDPIFIHHRGRLLEPMEVISDWCGPDDDRWRDMTLLPRSPREADHHDGKDRAADPLLKHGWVGAYCRSYDIHETIELFLARVYEPSEVGADGVPSRYSFLPGTLTNGAVVYDEGRFLFSHHGSDPCCGRNVNSFDLRRIHLYGHLDKPGDAEKPPQDQPSYKAMVEACRADPVVLKEMRESNYGDMNDAEIDAALGEGMEGVDDLEARVGAGEPMQAAQPGSEPPRDDDWASGLDVNANGIVKSNIANLVLILRNWPTFRGKLAHNAFLHCDCLLGWLRSSSLGISLPPLPGETWRRLQNLHRHSIRQILESPRGAGKPGWALKVSDRDLDAAIEIVCHENQFHPIREYLEPLVWDGVPRIELLWVKACHTPDTPYYRQTARNLLVASVARVFQPGCKFDFMPVLQGGEGIFKSTLVSTLGSIPWTGETPGHFDDKKKFVEATRGFWFVENSELTHFRRASDDDAIKAMLSATHDTVRLSYRHDEETMPRQFIIIGTTNLLAFLRDRHRRIWPIVIPAGVQIDLAWVETNRDQLFAEAVHAYREMARRSNGGRLPLHLTGEAAAEFASRQEDHILPDAANERAGLIAEWLATPVPVSQSKCGEHVDVGDAFANEPTVPRDTTCGLEILDKALHVDVTRLSRSARNAEAQEIARAMELIPGWTRGGMLRCGEYGRQNTYRRIA